ncbi:MAG: hypothetical protein HQ530_01780 [Parcubacteria group bacterium]|nr:hypothetical protein [Parcubacteria group bacterium]
MDGLIERKELEPSYKIYLTRGNEPNEMPTTDNWGRLTVNYRTGSLEFCQRFILANVDKINEISAALFKQELDLIGKTKENHFKIKYSDSTNFTNSEDGHKVERTPSQILARANEIADRLMEQGSFRSSRGDEDVSVVVFLDNKENYFQEFEAEESFHHVMIVININDTIDENIDFITTEASNNNITLAKDSVVNKKP